jgi:hypothetical protein
MKRDTVIVVGAVILADHQAARNAEKDVRSNAKTKSNATQSRKDNSATRQQKSYLV